MRILTVLTYYSPHISGLTIYAERLAKALVRRGHQVSVLTSQFEKSLPREETHEGVQIVRLPVLCRVSKGVIMPSFGTCATKMVLEHDALLLHLPQFDAAGVALRGRLFRRPTVMAYHCDLLLPPGRFNRLVNLSMRMMHHLAGRLADKVVAHTDDFASNSPYLTRFQKKLVTILPPVELQDTTSEAVAAFRNRHNPEGWRVIGMAGRFASEKGVEILLAGLSRILAGHPKTKVLYAGPYNKIRGEESYLEKLMPVIRRLQDRGCWEFLDILEPSEMTSFYQNIDVLVFPSLNSTESFGLVQIEAMVNGTPVVASDLPGVRQPVAITGMGEVVPPGDARSLGDCILRVFDEPDTYRGNPTAVKSLFRPDVAAAAYEELFLQLLERRKTAVSL